MILRILNVWPIFTTFHCSIKMIIWDIWGWIWIKFESLHLSWTGWRRTNARNWLWTRLDENDDGRRLRKKTKLESSMVTICNAFNRLSSRILSSWVFFAFDTTTNSLFKKKKMAIWFRRRLRSIWAWNLL